MKVLGTAGTPEGLALVLKAGAHQAFNHKEQNYIGKIKVGRGADCCQSFIPKTLPLNIM